MHALHTRAVTAVGVRVRAVAVRAAVAIAVAACTGGSTAAPAATGGLRSLAVGASEPAPASDSMAGLIAAAQAEGTLTTIALNRDWCNYDESIETFKAKYGLDVNELDPDAGPGDAIEAIKGNRDNRGPLAPDVIDVELSFGPSARTDGLIQPYKVATWSTIPDQAKDPEGYWYGGYYGVIAFETNPSIVATPPADWADLLGAEYRGKVALAGDPRVDDQAIQSVYAAALATGGSLDDAGPGLDFFRRLSDAGNLSATIARPATIDDGSTQVAIRWTFNALSHRDTAAENPEIDVTVPKTGRFGGLHVQAISAFAPHPNAARLWMEFLYSDEGQNLWLEGYCHPVRYEDLAKRDTIPADVLSRLPDTAGAVFPTADQLSTASELIATGWDRVVGVDIR